MERKLISHIRDLEGMQVLAVANRDISRIASILKELEISDNEIVLAGAFWPICNRSFYESDCICCIVIANVI